MLRLGCGETRVEQSYGPLFAGFIISVEFFLERITRKVEYLRMCLNMERDGGMFENNNGSAEERGFRDPLSRMVRSLVVFRPALPDHKLHTF